MKVEVRTGQMSNGASAAELWDTDGPAPRLLARMYSGPAGSGAIRVVMPGLKNMRQVQAQPAAAFVDLYSNLVDADAAIARRKDRGGKDWEKAHGGAS